MTVNNGVFYDPDLQAPTPEEEARVHAARVIMAQAYSQMLNFALDVQRTHGVFAKDLPEWKDTTLLDRAGKLPLLRGQELYLEYIRRIEHALHAAIRRKGMRLV